MVSESADPSHSFIRIADLAAFYRDLKSRLPGATSVLALSVISLAGCIGPEGDLPAQPPLDERIQDEKELEQLTRGLNPPGLFIVDRVQPFHGHVELVANVPSTNYSAFTATENVRSGPFNLTPGWNQTNIVPFVEPSREYALEVLDDSGQIVWNTMIQTPPNPYGGWGDPDSPDTIQPGVWINGGCTLSAILRDSTNETLFGLFPAHCGPKTKETIYLTYPNNPLATDVFGRYQREIGIQIDEDRFSPEGCCDTISSDWALIRIHDSERANVTPSIRYWTGPLGVADRSSPPISEQVCMYGWGQSMRQNELTRHRCGNFAGFRPDHRFDASFLVDVGDSGAPVIDLDSGLAIGYVVAGVHGSALGRGFCFTLEQIRADGHDVAYASSQTFGPPPYDPSIPITPIDTLNAFNPRPHTPDCDVFPFTI